MQVMQKQFESTACLINSCNYPCSVKNLCACGHVVKSRERSEVANVFLVFIGSSYSF